MQVKNDVPLRITAQLGIAPSADGQYDGQGNRIFASSREFLQAAAYTAGQTANYRPTLPFAYSGPEGNWSGTPLLLPTDDLPRIGHEFDSSVIANLTAEVYAVQTDANCHEARVTIGGNNTAIAELDDCSYNFTFETNQTFARWHFADSTACTEDSRRDAAFRAFVYAVYRPSNDTNAYPDRFLVLLCRPTLSISLVKATMSFTMRNGPGPFVRPPELVEEFPAGTNPTDPIVASLFEQGIGKNALNGFDIPQPPEAANYSRTARRNITRSILYESIYSAISDRVGSDIPSDPEADWCMQRSILSTTCDD